MEDGSQVHVESTYNCGRMKLGTDRPFFEVLRTGVEYIETNVSKLKEDADFGFSVFQHPLNDQEIQKVKNFDQVVRKTYAEVSHIFSKLNEEPFNLDVIENKVDILQKKLISYESDSGFKEFGYQPFVYETSSAMQSSHEPQNGHQSPLSCISSQESTVSVTSATRSIRKDNDKTKLLRSTFKVSARKTFKSPRHPSPAKNTIGFRYSKQPSNHEEKELKKITVVPFSLAVSPSEKENRFKAENLNYKKVCLNNESTMSTDCSVSNATFVQSLAETDTTEVTIEFTPGLTTKRRISKPSRGKKIFNQPAPVINPNPVKMFEGDSESSRLHVPIVNQTIIIKRSDPDLLGFSPNTSEWGTPRQNRYKTDTYRISNTRVPLRSAERAVFNVPDTPSLPVHSARKTKDISGIPEIPCLRIDMINPELHQKLLSKMNRKT